MTREKDMLAYSPADFVCWETLAKIFIIPARQNQSNQENISNSSPVRRIAFAMNTTSTFTGSQKEILI